MGLFIKLFKLLSKYNLSLVLQLVDRIRVKETGKFLK